MADPLYVPSFFGGDDPGALTYEQLLMRRKIAAALAQRQRGFPKNVGEGLTYLGESLGDRLELMRLGQAEKQARAGSVQRQAALNAAPGYVPGIGGGTAPAVAPPPRATTPPVPTPSRPSPPVAAAPDVAPADSIEAAGGTWPPLETPPPPPPPPPGATSMDLGPVYPPPPEGGWSGAPAPAADMMSGVRQRAGTMQPGAPAVDAAAFGGPTSGAEPKPPEPLNVAAPAPDIPPLTGAMNPPAIDPRGSPEWQRMNAYRIQNGQKPLPVPDPAMREPGYQPGRPLPGRPFGAPGPAPQIPPLTPGAMSPRSEGSSVDPSLTSFIAKQEGFSPTAYSDYKQTSIGYGTRGTPGETITREEAQRRLESEVANARQSVEKFAPDAPPGIKDALTSLTYNAGPGWQQAGLGRLVSEGRYDEARERFTQYNKAGGQTLPGLVNRRASEIATLWDAPEGGAGAVAGAPAPSGRDEVAATLAARQTPANAVTKADVNTDLLLAETVGVGGPGPDTAPSPQVASYAPPTSMTDAPALGLPMGNLPDMGDTTQARRGAIRGALPQPPMTPLVPAPAPGASPTSSGGPGAGAEPGSVRIAQVPPQMLGGSPGIPDASMFAPAPIGGFPGGAAPGGPIAPAPSARAPIAPAPVSAGAAPSSRPSSEPLPPAVEQTYADPGAPPVREQPPPLSQRQLQALRVLRDPFSMPDDKEAAKQLFELDEKERVRLEQQMENDFRSKRETWERNVAEKTKFERETPTRRVKELSERTSLEKTRTELEDLYYKQGIPREQARIKADLDIAEALRKVSAPETVQAGGTQFSRPYSPPGGPQVPFTVAPGLPAAKEEPLTEAQANALQFALRVRPDLDRVDTQLNKGKILTDATEATKDMVPGFGNYLVSDEYRASRDALQNWGAAFLTKVSGAAVNPSEAGRNLPAFIPRPGDTDADIDAKAQRRRAFTDAVAGAATPGAMKQIQNDMDKLNFDYQGRLPSVQIKSPAEARSLPPGQRLILPDGREGRVPLKVRP